MHETDTYVDDNDDDDEGNNDNDSDEDEDDESEAGQDAATFTPTARDVSQN